MIHGMIVRFVTRQICGCGLWASDGAPTGQGNARLTETRILPTWISRVVVFCHCVFICRPPATPEFGSRLVTLPPALAHAHVDERQKRRSALHRRPSSDAQANRARSVRVRVPIQKLGRCARRPGGAGPGVRGRGVEILD